MQNTSLPTARLVLRSARARALALALIGAVAPGASACETSSAESPAPAPAPGGARCQAGSGPTLHEGDIVGLQTWTAAASPHVLTGDVRVPAGTTLVIEPCAEVLVAGGAHLLVGVPGAFEGGGTLVAEGTKEMPIAFRGRDGARWASVHVVAPGTARFAHVTLENGGGDDFEDNATIHASGDGVLPADPVLAIDDVVVRSSLGPGVVTNRGATFASGSHDLIVSGSGSASSPYPVRIEEHAIDALPTGRYTGNAKDEILLVRAGDGTDGGGLTIDATLHERGVPYHVGARPGDSFAVGASTVGSLATLTIEPGVVMRFEPESALKVQAFESAVASTGAIRARGTAERPIVFTSAAARPAAGDWSGLVFNGIPRSTNELDHVRIEFAGYSCSCSLVTCSDVTTYDAAIVLVGPPERAFVTNTVFSNIAGHGVTEGFDGPFVDFRPTNTFDDVSGCAQILPRNVDTTCPAEKPACDGQ